MKNKILVTGGEGFIGSNFIKYLLETEKNIEIVNLDKQTYAGQGKNIEHMGFDKNKRYKFVKGDIANNNTVKMLFQEYSFDYVINFAAESFVDKSWSDDSSFKKSNVIGTGVLLKNALSCKNLKKIIHISTDETFGSIEKGSFVETDELNPANPYSKSKAEAEVLAKHYYNIWGLPVVITRSANNYGEYQYPEKVLPLFITNLIENKKVPLMWSDENPGLNVRDWLHVKDNCRAIWYLAKYGKIGEIYNIAGENERTNIEMTKKLLKHFGYGEEMIEKIEHRKAHDFRYSINCDKLKALGFKYKHLNLNKEIVDLCEWYKNNELWWKPLKK